MHIQDHMNANPVTVSMHSRYREASRLMLCHGAEHLPVVDSAGRLVGLLTFRELLAAGSQCAGGLENILISHVMNQEPSRMTGDASITTALLMLSKDGADCVVVVDSTDRVVGIVTHGDALRVMAKLLGLLEGGMWVEIPLPVRGDGFSRIFEVLRSCESQGSSAVAARTGESPEDSALFLRMHGTPPPRVEKQLLRAGLSLLRPEAPVLVQQERSPASGPVLERAAQ